MYLNIKKRVELYVGMFDFQITSFWFLIINAKLFQAKAKTIDIRLSDN